METVNDRAGKRSFTLPGLISLVAIIGLFSGIAIPNFIYYKASARVAEARLELANLYTSQITMYSDFSTYAGCLKYMGYNPEPEKSDRYYVVGFNVDTNVPNDAYKSAVKIGLKLTECPQKISAAKEGVNYFSAGKSLEASIANKDHLSNTSFDTKTGQKFTAGAAGIIDINHKLPGNSSLLTINEKKVMKVVRKGF